MILPNFIGRKSIINDNFNILYKIYPGFLVKMGRTMLCPIYLFLGIDDKNTGGTNQETDTGDEHHRRLCATHQ